MGRRDRRRASETGRRSGVVGRGLMALLTVAFVGACAAPETSRRGGWFDGWSGGGKGQQQGGGWGSLVPAEGRRSILSPGTGNPVATGAPPVTRQPSLTGEEGVQLNLVEAPIPAAAQFVLGETLGLNYLVDPNLGGTITLQTSTPVSEDALIDIFETALAANGFAIVETAGVYRIVDAADAAAGTPPVSVPQSALRGPGIRVLAVPLQYISAEEMRNILAPISPAGALLRFDPVRNYLMLAGTGAELGAMLDAISVFDVDWMKGKSVGLFSLQTASPAAIARELEAIFETDGGPDGVVRFVPNEQLGSILVITSQPEYLRRASGWINRLDQVAASNAPQLFVYPVKNRPAEELAQVLRTALGQETGRGLDGAVAPDLGEVEISVGNDTPGFTGLSQEETLLDAGTTVAADTENNSLLISATADEYRSIEPILRRLDSMPVQIFLEALIVEVALNDELRFGVRWFLEHGDGGARLSDLASGGVGPSFPGFAWNVADNDFEITLNALSSVTDVEVISSPTLMALNNQEAVLQIGDQVPVITRTAESVSDPGAPIVNSVELRDTGIILNVIPRVNATGGVLLEIEQEASRVVQTTSSGIDSPTIQQRRIRTRVSLNDGEALILGGLIQESTTRTKNGVPVLSDIPVLGNAFRDRRNRFERTELLIFVRPRVVRDSHAAQRVSDEFRRRMSLGNETYNTRMERDLQRLR